jgi:hypothetical protein
MESQRSRRTLLKAAGATALSVWLPSSQAAGRPRLILDDATVARARAALDASAPGKDTLRRVTRRAEELLALPPKQREFEPGRPVMLPTSREVLERVQTLGTIRLLTGDARFAARAVSEIIAACAQPDWNPAHFLDTAEMGHAIGIGLDWFGDAMTPQQRVEVVEALLRKAVQPGFEQFQSRSFWTTATHNWNIVCNGGLAIAALALRDEPGEAGEAARRLLPLTLDSVRSGFGSFAPDGGWVEGPAYWDYATRYAVYLLAALESAGVDDRGLGRTTGLAETGRFFLHMTGPTGLLFNFADSQETTRRSPHRHWLARRYDRPAESGHELRRTGSVRASTAADPAVDSNVVARGSTRAMQAAWFPERIALPGEAGEPRDALFKGAQVATFRSSWDDPRALFLACKGGSNAVNHAHLDLGTFVLDFGGERFALDLGPDDYALPGYFSKAQRFTYLRNASASHNLLLADGASQPADAQAPIALFRTTPGFAAAVVDLDAANPALRHRRGFALIDRQWALIVDEIAPRSPVTAAWQMHTAATPTLAGAAAVLRRGEASLAMRILAPGNAAFAAEPTEAPPPQNPNKSVTRLVARLGRLEQPTRVAVAFGASDAVPARVEDLARRPLTQWEDAV